MTPKNAELSSGDGKTFRRREVLDKAGLVWSQICTPAHTLPSIRYLTFAVCCEVHWLQYMDPLSALSIASNVIQFVDFGCKLFSRSRQLYKSLDGALSDNVVVEVLAHDLESLSNNLLLSLKENQPLGFPPQSSLEDDSALDNLCRRCYEISKKLLFKLDKLKVPGNSKYRNWESFKKALRSSWSHEEIEEISAQLYEFRSEIEFRVLISFRYAIFLLLGVPIKR